MKKGNAILTFESLEIGFPTGKTPKGLLPPINASAGSGELIAVIGKNGIGKSTLLRTLAGLQPSLRGSLNIGGKSIGDYSRKELAEKVGYISTEIIRVSNMTVYDLAALGRFPHTNWFGRIDAENQKAVMEALEKAGMTGFATRMISELSDGERQRAMIAMVLAQDASLMVLDEPTAFLDIRSKFEIMHLLHDLTRQKGKTIVFSTHDFDTAISGADKIWLMLEASFMEGAPEDLILGGHVSRLFNESVVKFNPHDGTFSRRIDTSGSVSVKGEEDVRFWTEKAVVRCGYTVSETKSSICIITPDNKNQCWRVETGEDSLDFNTIYELVSWLRDQTRIIS